MEAGLAGKVAALATAITDLQSVQLGALSPAELLDLCTATQRARNLLPTIEHPAITALTAHTTPAKIGAKSWCWNRFSDAAQPG